MKPFAARCGISLVEVLVSMTVTLILLLVLIRFFNQMSNGISEGRAVIEMTAESRMVRETVRRDLENATVSPRTWTANSTPNGYFEIIEGPINDSTTSSALGDYDDVLAMTVRSGSEPFRGLVRSDAVDTVKKSEAAEVVYFAYYDDKNNDGVFDFRDDLNVYRRVLLIRPDLAGAAWLTQAADMDAVNQFHQRNDLSVHWEPVNPSNFFPARPVPNSLADLALRENRFGRYATAFPSQLNRNRLINDLRLQDDPSVTTPHPGAGLLEGNDILMSGLAAFDLRVFSPNARVATVVINPEFQDVAEPSDPGSLVGVGDPEGAYVDLGAPNGGWFGPNMQPLAAGAWGGADRTWCSWTAEYERTAAAGDWIDNDNNGVADDGGERVFPPPYPYPIRGIKMIFRPVEKGTEQFRQFSIESSFLPQ